MSEIVAEGEIRADRLKQYLDVFRELVEEGRIHFNDGGLQTSVVDPANAAMIHPGRLDARAFDRYDAPGAVTIGVNFDTLSDRINAADATEVVSLAVDMETRKLEVSYRNIEHTVALIDPDAIRKEPDTTDIDLPNQMTITGADLDTVATQVGMVGDYVRIRADAEAGCVEFRGEGDTDATVVRFGDDDVKEAHITESTESLFSHVYIEEFCNPMPGDADVTLYFGEEFPLQIEWSSHEGDLTFEETLAPRIET